MTEAAPTAEAGPTPPGLAARLPWPRLLVFALAQLGLALLGSALTQGPGPVAVFWPASGLALGVLLVVPARAWPAYLAAGSAALAAFNLLAGQPISLAATFAAGNVLEPLVGASLACWVARGRPRMSDPGSIFALVLGGPLLAAPLANAVSAVALAGPPAAVGAAWLRHTIGAGLGMLAVAPLVLAWAERERVERPRAARLAEGLALGVVLAAVTWVAFLRREHATPYAPALLPPVLIWAALRFGPLGATTAGASVTLALLFGTLSGRGFFSSVAPADAGLNAQAFAALMHLSMLALTGVVESRRLAAEALRRSERELRLVRSATDAAQDLLLCADADGRVIYTNGAARAGGGSGLASGWIWDVLGTGAEPWALHWAELRRLGAVTLEVKVAGGDGEPIPHEAKLSRLSFDGREYAIAAARDLRERRQAEAALRMATVGTLSAGIAHEINNPLASVLANLEFAAGELRSLDVEGASADALASATGALAETAEGALRIRDIVRDLRVFSRAEEAADPGGADVSRALQAALTLSRHELRHRARVDVDVGELPRVRGSERRLGQVFLNLLVNAAHALPERDAAASRIRVSARAEGGEVVAEVEDNGCGMPPEVLARVFEPFFTTKAPGTGTGLGLSICHGIVTAAGGRIEVSSRPGRGSRFRLRLPLATAPEAAPGPSAVGDGRAASSRVARGRVLVVDDDPLVARVLERVLSDHEVVACTSPAAALARAREEPFALVLCDLMMPQMSGIEFQERLARERPALASEMIFLTGGAFTRTAEEFLERTPNLHLEKPFDTALLRTEVARRVERARP